MNTKFATMNLKVRKGEVMPGKLDRLKLDLECATSDAIHSLAKAAEDAKAVVAAAAAEALKVTATRGAGDHDLLIELRTMMSGVKADIKELKDGTANKIEDHEKKFIELPKIYTTKEDFNFWRNILVSGIIITIFSAVVLRLVWKI